MSLLMDALRKAELQKQQNSAQAQQSDLPTAWSAHGLALEPVAEAEAPGVPPSPQAIHQAEHQANSRLPELPARLEDLDEQFMAHAAQPVKKAPQSAVISPPQKPVTSAPERIPESSPEAARKLFEAKLPAPKGNRNFAIALSLLTLIAGVGIGGYFWWELQPKTSIAITPPPNPPAAQAAPLPTPIAPPPAAAPPALPVATIEPPAAVVPAVSPAPTSPPSAKSVATAEGKAIQGEREIDKPKTPARQEHPSTSPPVKADSDAPIRVSAASKKIDPTLEQAYQAFNRGEFALALAGWQKVHAMDPRNADALHGLATLALQNQMHDQAAEYYERALENDPRDARAYSGLMALKPPSDTSLAESRLKLLLAEQPNSPHLNFALGNLFARTTRWAEAQQAFFRAHTADATNPDYLFNLAVSLDQLHQPRLAARYYTQALDAASQHPAGFDTTQATVRLKALQSALQ